MRTFLRKATFSLWLCLSPSISVAECRLFYASKSDLEAVKAHHSDISTLSSGINAVLKKSFDFLKVLDHYTMGIVSGIILRDSHSLDDIEPNQWNQLQVVGSLIYQDSPINATPLRGTKLIFEHGNTKVETSTGADGEFAEYFYRLVPYRSIRLFPAPLFNFGQKYQKTVKIPLHVRVESKVCTAETTLTETPLEPIVLIASSRKD